MTTPAQALEEDAFLDLDLRVDVQMHERAPATKSVKVTWRLASLRRRLLDPNDLGAQVVAPSLNRFDNETIAWSGPGYEHDLTFVSSETITSRDDLLDGHFELIGLGHRKKLTQSRQGAKLHQR